ncbi:hypothetical protein [Microvirga sp. KLBC 81]|nr:hypothetical protein [Microvirga sp. KLBC 81]
MTISRRDLTMTGMAAATAISISPDRVEWRVHAAPGERDMLSGRMRVV